MKIFLIIYLILFLVGIVYAIYEFKQSGFNKSSLLPWYLLIWNALWFPIYAFIVIVFISIIFLYRGPGRAKEVIHDLT